MSRKTDAEREEIRQAVKDTADENGNITPDGVVAAARDPDSPLHREFDWDDASAAHQHRLAVARALIREIVYVGQDITGKPVTSVAYVHDPETTEQCFVPLSSAARNKAKAREILLVELGRCESSLRRAEEIAAVLKIETPLNGILQEILNLQVKVQAGTSTGPKPSTSSGAKVGKKGRVKTTV